MSRLSQFIQHAQGVTGYQRGLSRMRKLAGSSDEILGSHALANYVQAAPPATIELGIGTAAGAVAGAIIGHKQGHWLLGAIAGGSLFTNVPALLKPALRKEAFWNVAQTGAGVVASVAMKQNKALGFLLGYIALGFAREFWGDGQ